VVEGITSWVQGWLRNGWKTKTGALVKNQGLWQCLIGELERWNEKDMCVQVWRIPRAWNTVADHHARASVAIEGIPDEFTDIIGVLG
jgi:ribonuclease HI